MNSINNNSNNSNCNAPSLSIKRLLLLSGNNLCTSSSPSLKPQSHQFYGLRSSSQLVQHARGKRSRVEGGIDDNIHSFDQTAEDVNNKHEATTTFIMPQWPFLLLNLRLLPFPTQRLQLQQPQPQPQRRPVDRIFGLVAATAAAAVQKSAHNLAKPVEQQQVDVDVVAADMNLDLDMDVDADTDAALSSFIMGNV
ncbi:uncharacterized protein Dvir_GJ26925 [Drosophila virilis]|uniref:Uncharacterized protein n=1 Tax=Drosophila virilis TaxID=7244 RepID=A0A0Q9WTG4_DROVI|nr:uncharacterized protein Dvir_GJ26925 [Drosophila virilis]